MSAFVGQGRILFDAETRRLGRKRQFPSRRRRGVRGKMLSVHLLFFCLATCWAEELSAVRAAMERGDLAGAERALQAELQARPNDAVALGLAGRLGITFANAGQFDRAEALLTRALAADPANFKELYNLGVVALYAGHPQRAREVLEAALRQLPQNVDALYTLAYVDQALKRSEHALGLLAQAGRLAPERADIQKLMAIAATELRAYDDAIAAWDRYLKLEPNDDRARRERGSAAARIGHLDKAIPDLEWFASRHPADPMAHFELGIAEAERDPSKGLAHFDKAIALQGEFAAARSARGGLYYQQGKPEQALADLEVAARLQPEDPVILDRLGQTYVALDRPGDAVRVLRKAAGLAPAGSKIQFHFARALADAGETAESKTVMERFKRIGPAKADRVPAGLVEYLSLTPDQRRADYRVRVEKAVRENPGDAAAQQRYRTLQLEEGKASLAEGLAWLDGVPKAQRNAEYHLTRAQLLYAAGKPAEAARELDQAGDSREAQLLRAVARKSDELLGEIQSRWPEWYPVWLARGVVTGSRTALETAAALGARADGPRDLTGLLARPVTEW